MDNIILIGMPAAGKSTIGVIIAKRLGYQFVDVDLLIQEKEGKLLKDIIAERGIQGFLEVEDQVNAGLHVERTVISPGGSVVYCENAMKHFKKIGKVLYLKASFETISRRLKNVRGRGVVLGDGQTLKELYDERVELFEKYADIKLTKEGIKAAKFICNKHQTIKKLFVEVLNIDETIADKDACLIEHVISDESIKAMKVFMNNYKKTK